MIIEICTYRYALAHHIIGSEINAQGARAAGGLGSVFKNFANESRIIIVLEIEIQRQIVAHTFLLVTHFQYRVEVHNFVAHTGHKRLGVGFHQLTCRRIERERTGVAIFSIEGEIII